MIYILNQTLRISFQEKCSIWSSFFYQKDMRYTVYGAGKVRSTIEALNTSKIKIDSDQVMCLSFFTDINKLQKVTG